MSSVYSSATLKTTFIIEANIMNPDQTREQSDLDPHCLQYRLPVVECLTRDQGVAGSSLTRGMEMCP